MLLICSICIYFDRCTAWRVPVKSGIFSLVNSILVWREGILGLQSLAQKHSLKKCFSLVTVLWPPETSLETSHSIYFSSSEKFFNVYKSKARQSNPDFPKDVQYKTTSWTTRTKTGIGNDKICIKHMLLFCELCDVRLEIRELTLNLFFRLLFKTDLKSS